MQAISCPTCPDAPSRVLWQQPSYTLRACTRCGLAFRETAPDLQQYDGRNYFQEYLDQEAQFRGFFREILELIATVKQPPGRLLDVGCSVGLLLDCARQAGWTPVGVDVADWATTHARSRDLQVYCCPLEEAPFSPSSFDVIVVNHVLEHVIDPCSLLRRCHGLLRPNGVLFIGVPNFGSIMARIEQEHWPALQPDEHIWQFSRQTLTALLKHNGLAPRVWRTGMQPRNYTWSPKDVAKRGLFALAARVTGGEVMSVVATAERAKPSR